jgi:hypothetical protein
VRSVIHKEEDLDTIFKEHATNVAATTTTKNLKEPNTSKIILSFAVG